MRKKRQSMPASRPAAEASGAVIVTVGGTLTLKLAMALSAEPTLLVTRTV